MLLTARIFIKLFQNINNNDNNDNNDNSNNDDHDPPTSGVTIVLPKAISISIVIVLVALA